MTEYQIAKKQLQDFVSNYIWPTKRQRQLDRIEAMLVVQNRVLIELHRTMHPLREPFELRKSSNRLITINKEGSFWVLNKEDIK